jgi:flagellar motor switch protein FliG
MAQAAQEKMSGTRKAAVLMVLLGDKAASKIYQHLPHEQIEDLTQEISRVDYVPPEVAAQVLDEFNKLSITDDYLSKGGVEYAQQLLINAFGEATAKELISQVLRSEEISVKDLDVVQKADPERLARLIQDEHPQTIALLIAHLGSRAATTLLKLLPEKTSAQVVERLAKMRQFSPEMVQKIIGVLNKKIQGLGKQQQTLAYGGTNAVADLLNRMEITVSKTILANIEQQDANLALAIRNQMFTFEDFMLVPETSIRELLGQVDKKTLAIALKSAKADLRDHFFKTMSSRAVEMLNEDIEALPAVRARELSQAQQEIVQTARKLEAEGKIVLKEGEEDAAVV